MYSDYDMPILGSFTFMLTQFEDYAGAFFFFLNQSLLFLNKMQKVLREL